MASSPVPMMARANPWATTASGSTGLIDEMQIHLVPVLMGAGTRLFDHLRVRQVDLATSEVINIPSATHLKFHFVNTAKNNQR